MTPVFSVRRRAEEFDSLIESTSGADLSDARYAEFVEIVRALRDVPAAQPRPAFVSSLRDRLMVAAETELVPAAEGRLVLPARRPRDRRIAAAVGGFAIVGATTSMAMAAQTALPGDVLYPLKRAIENVETGISVTEGQKGVTMLANASGRLDEVSELSRTGGPDDVPAIAETLNTFTEQATTASDLLLSDYARTGDEGSISDLRDFTSLSMETLAALETLVPGPARDELLHAAQVLTQIDAEARQACPTCGGADINEIPAILAEAVNYASGGVSVDAISRQYGEEPGATRGPGRKKQQEPALPSTDEDGGALPPGSVLVAGDETDDPTGRGDGEKQSTDPIGDLTNGLVQGGGTQPASSPSGLPGVPDDTVDELESGLEDVTDTLTGTD